MTEGPAEDPEIYFGCTVCGGSHSQTQIDRYGCPYNLDQPWPHKLCKCLRCSAARAMAQARRLYALNQKAESQGVKNCCPVERGGPLECTHCGLSGHRAAYCSFLDRNGRDLKEHGIWELEKEHPGPDPKIEHAGCQEVAPPGSPPSREPPPGGRSAQPTSGGLCGCGAPEPRPLDRSCWEVAVAAHRLKLAGKKEEQVRRLFALMIEGVYLSTEETL